MYSQAHKFDVGDIVHHQRYDYRGVVVSWDARCEADEDWYQNNQTQPDREQPWYHVLVDGSDMTTYVAQENLEAAKNCMEVSHPLVNQFFTSYFNGRYYREPLN